MFCHHLVLLITIIMTHLKITNSKGVVFATLAFLIWGVFPLYFKQLERYDAIEIIVHRVIWTFGVLLLVMIFGRRTAWLLHIKHQPKWIMWTFISAMLIATNWLTYVWAVNHDKVLEASLGYFIQPLMGVALSLAVFKEKLRFLQKVAIALAGVAVCVQVMWLGGLPWLSLLLATSFALYGVIQRQTPFDAIDGLFLETVLLLPICLGWLAQASVVSSSLAFWMSKEIGLLVLAGPITLVPLLLYNASTKLVNFTVLSFLGYLGPSIVFLLAVFYYHEAFDIKKLMVFALIWIGLMVFSWDMVQQKVVKGVK